MNNKDEKTFADLFSSSTLDDDKTVKNFNDILNFDSKEQNSDNTGITFGSLKENVNFNDDITETKNIELKGNMLNNADESNVEVVDLFKSNEEVDKEINFNSIFDSASNVDLEEKRDDIEAIEESNLFFDDNENAGSDNVDNKEIENTEEEINLNNNMFFGTEVESNNEIIENNNVQEKQEEVTFFGNENLNDYEEVIEIKNAEEDTESNDIMFFDDEVKTNDNMLENNETQEKQEELSFFGNLEFDDNKEEKKVHNSEDYDLNDNMFFKTDVESNNEILENNTVQEKQEEVTFFGNADFNDNEEVVEIKNTEEDTELNNNMFFDTIVESGNGVLESGNVQENDNEVSILESLKKDNDTDLNEKINNSTSPFFEDDVNKQEEPINVFFENKISLVENKLPTISNSNIKLDNAKHFNVKIVKKKEPLFKFIVGVFSYAIFIWLLLIGVTLLVYVLDIKIRAAKGDYSAPTFNAYVVLTGSMLPDIQVSDVVITKKTEAKDLQKGDIITFASADSRFRGTIITHRIIKKNPSADGKGYTFQTKGDNNNVADSALVPENNIYGKVILKIPKLGYLQEFLASDGGWIIVILIPCLVVISYDTVKLVKGLKRKKYKNIKVQK